MSGAALDGAQDLRGLAAEARAGPLADVLRRTLAARLAAFQPQEPEAGLVTIRPAIRAAGAGYNPYHTRTSGAV